MPTTVTNPVSGPVLGIETSCDETAAAVVAADGSILSNIVFSQLDEHRPYGGVVPEIAARAHIHHLNDLISRAMDEANLSFGELAGVATTSGPGLIGGVMVGLMSAKAIASVHNKPFMAINHLEGHALTARLTEDVVFPYLLLLVSGGHCQLLIVKGVGNYQRLGTTIDDAVGEAYDKTAKKLGLGYPGGPAVEAAALTGDPTRFNLPRPLIRRADCHFSFSGLKTALSRTVDGLPAAPTDQDKADLCASFQAAVGDVLCNRTARAMDWFMESSDGGPKKLGADPDQQGGAGDGRPLHPGRDVGDAGWEETASIKGSTSWGGRSPSLVIAGGVAANQYLRARLNDICAEKNFTLACPPIALCTDNAAMVAWAGVERLALGLTDTLDTPARARWPLDPDAPAAIGAGVKA
jgi:N6-L-threonylcarbamoyladenine synthase